MVNKGPAPNDSNTPPTIEALVAKHRDAIDRVKTLGAKEQMQAFVDLGVNPIAIEAHYKDLAATSRDLKHRDASADTKTTIMGWAGAIAGTYAMYKNRMKFSDNKIVRGFAVPLAGVTVGLAATFAGSRIFSGKIREESRHLDVAARSAMERELAIALENRETEREKADKERGVVAPSGGVTTTITPRDKSFTVQVATENAAAESRERQHA